MEHKSVERLMLFIEVAKQLNFSASATTLGVSKGYLSEQIKQLETDLGVPLLVRTTRSVKLTSEGEKALACGVEIKQSALNLKRSINVVSGDIRLTAPKLFTEKYLLDICQRFSEINPEVTFSIDTSYNKADLNQDNIDLAFRATNSPPENMVAKPLLDYRHLVVASPVYLKEKGSPDKITDLTDHNCLTAPNIDTWQFKSGNIRVKGEVVINDNQLLKSLAISDKGLVRLPDYYTEEERKQGVLHAVLCEEAKTAYKIYLLHPPRVNQSGTLKRFIEFATSYFKSLI